jgi:mycofactocin precursor
MENETLAARSEVNDEVVTADDDAELIEEISIDGMCGVY